MHLISYHSLNSNIEIHKFTLGDPVQIINEKFVKKFIVYPKKFSTKKVIKNASGIEIVAIKDSIPPTNIDTITNTIAKVETIFTAKSL